MRVSRLAPFTRTSRVSAKSSRGGTNSAGGDLHTDRSNAIRYSTCRPPLRLVSLSRVSSRVGDLSPDPSQPDDPASEEEALR